MPELPRDPTGRRFIPAPANSKPSDLFCNAAVTSHMTRSSRFVGNRDYEEYLIFISGLSASVGTAPERAVYAYVWGPHGNQQDENHEVGDLDHKDDPQTDERAQLVAATKALELLNGWCILNVRPPRRVVLAFSGNSFLNQVARSDFLQELVKGKGNLDLKYDLEIAILTLENKGVTVKFWLIDNENRADDVAGTWLYGKEHWAPWAVRTVLTMI